MLLIFLNPQDSPDVSCGTIWPTLYIYIYIHKCSRKFVSSFKLPIHQRSCVPCWRAELFHRFSVQNRQMIGWTSQLKSHHSNLGWKSGPAAWRPGKAPDENYPWQTSPQLICKGPWFAKVPGDRFANVRRLKLSLLFGQWP